MISLAPEQLQAQLIEDELVSELLVLHGLHPVDIETRVRAAIADRPEGQRLLDLFGEPARWGRLCVPCT